MLRKIVFTSVASLFFSGIFCQGTSGIRELEKYFDEALNGKSYYISSENLSNISSDRFIRTITPYLNTQDVFVRYKTVDAVKRKGLLMENSKDRDPYIQILIEACKDDDSGVSGVASRALSRFSKSDLTPVHGDSIAALLKPGVYFPERIVRLAGFAGMQEELKLFSSQVQEDSTGNAGINWSVQLAMARMGDSSALSYCLAQVKTSGLNDNVVHYLYPDLVYTRQAEAYKLMLDGILTDRKACFSSNPDVEAEIICAFRIMELVAPTIENFPIPLTSYGELEIDDYDKTLDLVRNWIREDNKLILNLEPF